MGVRFLNSVLKEHCKYPAIKSICFADLSDKFIVIDANIYLYTFKSQGLLYENFDTMLKIFIKYHIYVVFIFDGKPDHDKKHTLKNRATQKRYAEKKITEINTSENMDNSDKDALLKQYRKTATKIYAHEKNAIKSLISSHGFDFIQAESEADSICAYINKYYAFATMSEDMDLFIYGCKNILKQIDLVNETLELYNTQNILESLGFVSHQDFQQVCVLAGTDYFHIAKFNIFTSLAMYLVYTDSQIENSRFIDWCYESRLVNKYQFAKLNYVIEKFNNICTSECRMLCEDI